MLHIVKTSVPIMKKKIDCSTFIHQGGFSPKFCSINAEIFSPVVAERNRFAKRKLSFSSGQQEQLQSSKFLNTQVDTNKLSVS